MSAAEDTARQDAWHSVETSFAALGRAVLILDAAYHVLQASYFLDTFVCEGTRDRLLGRSVSDLLGSRLFVPGDALHRALSQGHRAEGRRAFIKCPRTGAQLVSLSVAPLPGPDVRVLHDRARFIVVIRPADAPGLPNEMDDALLARSPGMLQIVSMVEALSESEATVLITGESGTGKEVVARAIHAHSPRADAPMIRFNCAAIPAELAESELFGHGKGAFTGATATKDGYFGQAAGGTLILDEIGELPLNIQATLLRALQDGEIQPVGGELQRVDVRVVATTNADLAASVRAGRFREDLFYRLAVVELVIPPLRERRDDIAPLAAEFARRYGEKFGLGPLTLEPALVDALIREPWPGNVRQLENTCRWLTVMASGREIHISDLPPELRSDNAPEHPIHVGWQQSLELWAARAAAENPAKPLLDVAMPQFEETMIRVALRQTGGRKQDAAKLLGWGRNTLTRKMTELKLTDL